MFFEDLPVGKTFETGSRTVTADAIKRFAREWDPQPFHLDERMAEASPYGALIASGFHTVLIAFTLTLDASDWSDSSMGSPGMESIRWIAPVFADDTLRVKAEVIAARPSRSKPDRGFVELHYRVFNQNDAVVATYQATLMLRRRDAQAL